MFERIHQLFRYTRISSGVMWCVWSSFTNLSISKTLFFRATDVKHVLAELLVSDEPIVDTQVELLLAFLLERVRDVVLVIPWLLPVMVPVGSPYLYIVVRNRKEIHCVLNNFSPLFRCARSALTCSRRCRRPSMIDIPCTVLWVPYRVVHTIRCSQLHE